MTGVKLRLAAATLGAFGLLAATGYAAQAAPVSAAQSAVVLAAATTPSASHLCGTQSKPGAYKRVIWIWLENHSYNAVLGSSPAPYFNTLAKDCGVTTRLLR